MYKQVDHKNHDSLDNKKENLRVVEAGNNSANRKGANKNNGTGVRNIFWSKRENCYYVSIMKNGIPHKKKFEVDEFEKAKEFAKEKRKELFGEYAGKGESDII